MPALRDISGERIGHWKILKYLGNEHWLCLCLRCKRKYKRKSNHLISQKHGMCFACFHVFKIKHGHSMLGHVTRAYNCWRAMKKRCEVPSLRGFHNYGGRGITVCRRWQKFNNFLADMGEPPSGMTIERINNNSGYRPSNCAWKTRVDQSNNRRTNRFVVYRNRKMTVTQFAASVGVHASTICRMLTNLGVKSDQIVNLRKVKYGSYKRFIPC